MDARNDMKKDKNLIDRLADWQDIVVRERSVPSIRSSPHHGKPGRALVMMVLEAG